MAKTIHCCICGKELSLWTGSFFIPPNHYVCPECVANAGYNPNWWPGSLTSSPEKLRKRIAERHPELQESIYPGKQASSPDNEKSLLSSNSPAGSDYMPHNRIPYSSASDTCNCTNTEATATDITQDSPSTALKAIPWKSHSTYQSPLEKQLSSECFVTSRAIGDVFFVDRHHHKWYTLPKMRYFATNQGSATIHTFDEILSYDLIEDGNSITKGGLGSAIIGGTVGGPIGAIVGGSVGKRTTSSICTSLAIKITLKNISAPTEYVELIRSKTPKRSSAYKTAYAEAQEILSLLENITLQNQANAAPTVVVTQNAPESTYTAADEILKYKQLLDAGAITQEEYDAKKKQLLGL